jgi:anti-sigma factor RsiW
MKTCDHFERLISDAADAPLDVSLMAELRDHLASCAECRMFQESVGRSSQLLRQLPDAEMTSSSQRGNATKKNAGPLQRIWRARISIPAPLALAALMIVVGLSVWIASRRSAVETPVRSSQPSAVVNYVQVEEISPSSGTRISTPQKP